MLKFRVVSGFGADQIVSSSADNACALFLFLSLSLVFSLFLYVHTSSGRVHQKVSTLADKACALPLFHTLTIFVSLHLHICSGGVHQIVGGSADEDVAERGEHDAHVLLKRARI